jgi:hypothetical protein
MKPSIISDITFWTSRPISRFGEGRSIAQSLDPAQELVGLTLLPRSILLDSVRFTQSRSGSRICQACQTDGHSRGLVGDIGGLRSRVVSPVSCGFLPTTDLSSRCSRLGCVHMDRPIILDNAHYQPLRSIDQRRVKAYLTTSLICVPQTAMQTSQALNDWTTSARNGPGTYCQKATETLFIKYPATTLGSDPSLPSRHSSSID